MNKNMVYKLLISLFILAGGVLWLLSVAVPNIFGWFGASCAVAVATGGAGLLLVVKGVFKQGSVSYKKGNVWLGVVLLIVTIFSLTWGIVMPKEYIAPLVCIVMAFGLVLGIVATGGEKWDMGDNQKQGYKNYHQRKAEELENEQKTKISNDEKIVEIEKEEEKNK